MNIIIQIATFNLYDNSIEIWKTVQEWNRYIVPFRGKMT